MMLIMSTTTNVSERVIWRGMLGGNFIFSGEAYSEETVPFFEVYWWRRVFGGNSYNGRFYLRRRSEIILSNLLCIRKVKGGREGRREGRTFMICATCAHICTFTLSRQYNESPGLATRRNANSLWNINIQVLGNGLHWSNLNTKGDEIYINTLFPELDTWYGVLEIQTSKYGNRSSLQTSPNNISNCFCSGLAISPKFNSNRGKRGVGDRTSLELV